MDDILSAALGQSGLNLNFLESHDQTDNGAKPLADDGDEDVTDLLNLLNSDAPANESASKNGMQSNMLDLVLNYQSDEENLSDVPSPQPPQLSICNNIYSAHDKSISLFESSSRLKALGIPKHHKQLSQRNISNRIQASSPASLLLNKLTIPARNDHNRTASNTSNQIRTSRFPGESQIYNDNLNDVNLNNRTTSDIEKRKQSIQHVLASPNLTVREKQFLMKSALSHQMIPTLSPTTTK